MVLKEQNLKKQTVYDRFYKWQMQLKNLGLINKNITYSISRDQTYSVPQPHKKQRKNNEIKLRWLQDNDGKTVKQICEEQNLKKHTVHDRFYLWQKQLKDQGLIDKNITYSILRKTRGYNK